MYQKSRSFVYFLQNGEFFAFKKKILRALCQFNSTSNQESFRQIDRVSHFLQCVSCARRSVLWQNGLLLVLGDRWNAPKNIVEHTHYKENFQKF